MRRIHIKRRPYPPLGGGLHMDLRLAYIIHFKILSRHCQTLSMAGGFDLHIISIDVILYTIYRH